MFNYSTISKLLMIPVLASLLILVVLNGTSLYKSFVLLDHFKTLEKTQIQAERDVHNILISFKTQVQEWKNVLLRGSNEKDRAKYWNRFQQREKEITEQFSQMLTSTEMDEATISDILQFQRAHKLMAEKYREGYAAFVASNFNPKVGDSYVRGIDRKPGELLQTIAKRIATESAQAIDKTQKSTRKTLWLILLLAIVLSILAMVYVVWRLNSQIISPIKQIAKTISALAKSQYGSSLSYTSQHELGVLANAARELQSKLITSVDELHDFDSEMSNATKTLSTVAEAIIKGAAEQRDTSKELDSSTDKLKEIALNLVAITDQVAVATNNSESNIATCYTTFEHANTGFKHLAKTVTKTSQIVTDLQNRSANILKVVNVINEIADQTNLLALNAAIEAARAGEHGRGFAVVADEVRALAAKTQQSTKEINHILTSFEAEARGAVVAMEEGKQLSETNAEEASSALQTLDKVVDNIQETSRIVTVLNEAADEQEAVLHKVENVISSVVSSSERFHELAQQDAMSQSMRKMEQNVERVVRSITAN